MSARGQNDKSGLAKTNETLHPCVCFKKGGEKKRAVSVEQIHTIWLTDGTLCVFSLSDTHMLGYLNMLGSLRDISGP